MPKKKAKSAEDDTSNKDTEPWGQYCGRNLHITFPNVHSISYVRSSFDKTWLVQTAAKVRKCYTHKSNGEAGLELANNPIIPLSSLKKILEVATGMLSTLPNVVIMGVPMIPKTVTSSDRLLQLLTELKKEGEKSKDKVAQLESLPNVFVDTSSSHNKIPNTLKDIPKMIVVGDLHGTYEALFNVLGNEGLPSPARRYVFVGDYVDRGGFSVEVFATVLVLFITSPSCCIPLRGNHETRAAIFTHSLRRELMLKYGKLIEQEEGGLEGLLEKFVNCYQQLPLYCCTGEHMISHAGFPSGSKLSIEALQTIKRTREPDSESNKDPLNDILWADVYEGERITFNTDRLTSVFLPPSSTFSFLSQTGATTFIRGHTCVPDGILKSQDGHTITVSSVPSPETPRTCAYLVLLKPLSDCMEKEFCEELERRLGVALPDITELLYSSKKDGLDVDKIMGQSIPDCSFFKEIACQNTLVCWRGLYLSEHATAEWE